MEFSIDDFHKICRDIYNDRNAMYKDVWKIYELITNIDHAKGKLCRVLEIAKKYYKTGINMKEIEAMDDDLIDTVNYCFFVNWKIRQLKEQLNKSGKSVIIEGEK